MNMSGQELSAQEAAIPAFIPLDTIGVGVPQHDLASTPSRLDMLKARVEGWAVSSSLFANVVGVLPEGMVTSAATKVMDRMERHERPLVASINTINKCNLHCAGCYWGQTERQAEKQEELSLEDGQYIVEGLWNRGVRQFMFIGGEPLMTPNSRENVKAWTTKVAELGGFSTVVTNGTYGLPEAGALPNTHYFVSFDGGELGMNRVRGKDRAQSGEPVFDVVSRVLLDRAARTSGVQGDVMLAMTINGLNFDTLDDFMSNAQEWNVGGVAFSFSTPQLSDKKRDGNYPSLYLGPELRNATVKRLLEIKDKYGDFVAMSRRAIELLDTDEVAKWSPNCPTWYAESITSEGTTIERCIFGPDADCSLCGCNITTSVVALQEGDKGTILALGQPQRLAKQALKHSIS